MNHPKYFRASSLVCLLLVLVFGFADPVFGQAAVEGKEKSGQSSDGRLEAILENSTQEETKKQKRKSQVTLEELPPEERRRMEMQMMGVDFHSKGGVGYRKPCG